MAYYVMQTEEMTRMLELLPRVLAIRITYFDLCEIELENFRIHGMTDFCRSRRRDPEFNARCETCDRENLETAKKLRDVHIYRCHAGLMEGIVPFYNRRGVYLGAIMFGQRADRDRPVPGAEGLRSAGVGEMRDIGRLLKYLSEYICEHELIRQCETPWSRRLEEYVERHPDEKITLEKLASALGKSKSFLTHAIPREFGMTLTRYLRKQRMERAVRMLNDNRRVRECAFALGYSDEFYFSREFRRYFGFPPSELKKRPPARINAPTAAQSPVEN